MSLVMLHITNIVSKVHVLIAAICTLAVTFAHGNETRVFIDCNLISVPVAGVNCSQLQASIISSFQSVRMQSNELVLSNNASNIQYEVNLTYFDEPQNQSIRYILRYIRMPIPRSGQQATIERVVSLRVSRGAAVSGVQHMMDLSRRITVDLLDIVGSLSAPQVQDGVVSFRLTEPVLGNGASQSGQWAVSPSGGFSLNAATSTSINAGLGVSVLGSWPRHVVRIRANGNYQYSSLQLPDGQVLTGEALSYGASVFYVLSLSDITGRSIWRRFGINLAARGHRDPLDNLDAMAGGTIGIEWILNPRVDSTSQPNFVVRYSVTSEYQRYLATTIRGRNQDVVFSQQLGITGRFHWSQLDFTISGAARTLLDSELFPTLSADATLEYRPIPALMFRLNGGVDYSPNLSNQAWVTPPVELGVLGTNQGFPVVATYLGLTVQANFGNANLANSESRGQ